MNELFATLGIQSWKAWITTFILPPIPFLLLILVGMRLVYKRRLLAWSLVLSGVVLIYASTLPAVGYGLMHWLTPSPRALISSDLADLKKTPKTAVLVLGAGRELLAPEYGVSNLRPFTIERLRYGLWLSRETGLPLGYSGGISHGSTSGPTEAEIAQRIVEREFGRKLQFVEDKSRDTNENAQRSLALLGEQGYERVVVVTHGFHMARTLAAFDRAKQRQGSKIEVIPAPMGLARRSPEDVARWLPSNDGFMLTRLVLREWLGRIAGA